MKLIAVKGFGKEPMVILTSEHVRGKRQVLRVIRQYLDRWAVEESYRFEKTGLNLESINVRTLEGFKNMVSLVNLSFSFIAVGLLEKEGKVLAEFKLKAKRLKPNKRIKFQYYSLLEGISSYFRQSSDGLYRLLRRKPDKIPETQQLSLNLITTLGLL